VVKERVELYLYSPSGPSWSVLGRDLPFLPFTLTKIPEMGIVKRMQSGPRRKANRNLPSLLNMEETYSW
jgi:hypothetical protein